MILSIVKNGKNINYIQSRQIGYSFLLMKKEMEKLKSNPYFDKYGGKIATLQETEPEEFLERADKAFKKESSKVEQKGKGFTKVTKSPKQGTSISNYGFTPIKKLEGIMKIELLENKTQEEIKYIWTEHFQHKDAISGVMATKIFNKIQERALKYPMFLFPLMRDQGYEFIYAQFANNEIHFTSLINYQAYQENAPECMTMVHYPDLADTKNVVLMVGEYSKDNLSPIEAQFLANQVQLYYGEDNAERLAILDSFHKTPDNFKHMDLVDQIQTMSIGDMKQPKK